MTVFGKAKEILTEKAVSLWLGAIGALLALVGKVLIDAVLPTLSAPAVQQALLPLLGLSILINISLILALWFLARRPKFRTRFGFLWDADLQPYCPACNSPMQWGNWGATQGPGLLCGKCRAPRYLADDAGQKMTIQEARKQLSGK